MLLIWLGTHRCFKSKILNKFEILNVGGGKGTTVLELVRKFEEISGVQQLNLNIYLDVKEILLPFGQTLQKHLKK